MKRTIDRIGLLSLTIVWIVGCSQQPSYPTTFDVPGVGKADGTACPVLNRCASSEGFDTPLVPLNAPMCPARDPDRPAANEPYVCSLATSCFPRSVEGTLNIASEQYTPQGMSSGCEQVRTPFYWFKGGDKPYLLSARIESVKYQDDWFGRGKLKFEVRVFENGRNVDPGYDNPTYASGVDGFSRVINPNDVVVLLPIPAHEWFWQKQYMLEYKVTFSRQEVGGEPEYSVEQAKPDLYIESFEVRPTPGDKTVNFHAKVCNRGGSVDLSQIEDVKLKVYHNAATKPACGAATSHEEAVGGWFWEGTQYCRSYSFQQRLEQGPYNAWAVIDAECKVDELTEEANAASFPYQVVVDDSPKVQARLSVTMYKAMVEENTIHYKAMVCNNGGTLSRVAKLRVWQHHAGVLNAQSPHFAHEWQIPQLQPMWNMDGTANTAEPRCTEVLTFKQEDVARGTFSARWLLVADDVVVEEELQAKYTIAQDPPVATEPAPAVTEPEPKPEPAATEPEPKPEPAATEPEPKPEPAATEPEPKPEPAATEPAPAATEPEPKPAPAATDPEPTVAPKADLHVKDFTAEVIGDLVAFTITVCNRNDTAATFKLGLFLDVAEPGCGTGIKPETEWTVTALAKDCVTKGVTHAIPNAGKFTASALADHKCEVDEDKEDKDNRKSHDYEVKAESDPTAGAPGTTERPATAPPAAAPPAAAPPAAAPPAAAPPTTPRPGANPNGYYPPATAKNEGGCSLGGTPSADGSLALIGLVLLALLRRRSR